MNLMDVLLFQDRNELIKLLKDDDIVACNINSKRELVEILYPMLVNLDHVTNRYNRLTNDAKKMALTLCYDQNILLSKEELNGFVPYLKESAFLEMLEELTANGFLFTYINRTYLVPTQVKKELRRSIKMRIEEEALILPNDSNTQSEITIVNDLFVLIDYIVEKPLSLTKAGVLYKKDFQEIMKQFSYKEVLPKEQWRFGYGRRFAQYPDRFSLIYDFCFHKGWIVENDSTLTATMRVEELYEMRLQELVKSIVTYWHKLYRRAFPTVGLLYELLLDSLNEGEGFEVEFLVSLFSPFVKEYFFDTKEDIIIKRFLNMLMYLDIVKKIENSVFVGVTVGPSMKFLKKL